MRIGIIIGSLGMGGAERVSVTLAEWWFRRGHDVTIFTTMRRPVNEYQIDEIAARVECFDEGGRLRTILNLREAIKNSTQDVLLIMDTPMCAMAIPAIVGLGIPSVVSERSAPNTNAIRRGTRIVSHALMHLASGFVFQTEGAAAYYAASIRSRSVVIPNPLNVSVIPDAYDGERDKRVVAVGRLVPAKNYRCLVDAFRIFAKTHADYSLEVYGDGPLRAEIERYIRDCNLDNRIVLMGNREDVLERIRKAGMFVLSSSIEGMPNALIEAMALGIPAISTDCPSGGPRTLIVHGKNGLLVPVDDSDELSAAMIRLADDKLLSKSISGEELKIRTELNVEAIGQKWLDFFEDIVEP